jgi:hypothetical protein
MTPDASAVDERVRHIEHSARRTRLLAVTASIGLLATWLTGAAWPGEPQDDVVRARLLVIEDEQGRDRIVLGAPLGDGRQYTGMKILNADGAEQFAVSLKADGSVGMGFDVMPGVGDPRNRERLNLGVTATGRGWIRYLDNGTRARLFVTLDSTDAPVVQFLDWPDDERILVRQLGFSGDEMLEWER